MKTTEKQGGSDGSPLKCNRQAAGPQNVLFVFPSVSLVCPIVLQWCALCCVLGCLLRSVGLPLAFQQVSFVSALFPSSCRWVASIVIQWCTVCSRFAFLLFPFGCRLLSCCVPQVCHLRFNGFTSRSRCFSFGSCGMPPCSPIVLFMLSSCSPFVVRWFAYCSSAGSGRFPIVFQ